MQTVVAFVPVRGGSESIPHKNIRHLNDKPLVFWCLSALQLAPSVTEIVVATDDDIIAKTVTQFNLDKVIIYRRLPENATHTASTESVMIEYLQQANRIDNSLFMLVQATNPFSKPEHIEAALQQMRNQANDSILSCVSDKHFYWDDQGEPINYDYRARPRRQDFSGWLKENGAFYINSIANIKRDKNRLSGNIGIYEMPAYSGFEIDEPDDWIIAEQLLKRHNTMW